jgi:hypothetical protein
MDVDKTARGRRSGASAKSPVSQPGEHQREERQADDDQAGRQPGDEHGEGRDRDGRWARVMTAQVGTGLPRVRFSLLRAVRRGGT